MVVVFTFLSGSSNRGIWWRFPLRVRAFDVPWVTAVTAWAGSQQGSLSVHGTAVFTVARVSRAPACANLERPCPSCRLPRNVPPPQLKRVEFSHGLCPPPRNGLTLSLLILQWGRPGGPHPCSPSPCLPSGHQGQIHRPMAPSLLVTCPPFTVWATPLAWPCCL